MGPLRWRGAGIIRLAERAIPARLVLQSSLCAGLLLTLGILSWDRTWAYENVKTLWSDTLAKNSNCWVAADGLGNALLQEGRVDESIALVQKALLIYPNYAHAHNNLGNALLQKGQVDDAIDQYERALEIDPRLPKLTSISATPATSWER